MECGSPEEADQGWMSWAWSFVPAIVGAEEEGEGGLFQQNETGGNSNNPQQHTCKDPVVSIGFYCTKASVTFKVNLMFEKQQKINQSLQTVILTYTAISHVLD